jgi:quinol monooxygenase YgiN
MVRCVALPAAGAAYAGPGPPENGDTMKRVLILALLPLLAASCCPTCKQPPPAAAAAPAAGKQLIGARLQVKAEQVEAFTAAAKAVIAASRAEPGCISYTLLQDPYDKTVFFFFEEWKNQQAIDDHFATQHFKDFGAQLKDMLAGKPAITIYACPSEKKVD